MRKTWLPKTLLWDLDGTLAYWENLWIVPGVAKLYLRERPAESSLFRVFLAAAKTFRETLRNQGPQSNDDRFVQWMSHRLRRPSLEIRSMTERFLHTPELAGLVKKYIRPIPEALELLRDLIPSGTWRHLVATNPVMPAAFNRLRLRLAGYPLDWFEYIAGSEDFCGQKKQVRFYEDFLRFHALSPGECLMIGNDQRKDLIAGDRGIRVFLLRTRFRISDPSRLARKADWEGDYGDLRKGLLEGFSHPEGGV